MPRDEFKPLPRLVQWWRRTRDRRQRASKTLKTTAAKCLTLAFSALGAILVSYGVWTMHEPSGLITAGILCWVLQWSHEKDRGSE